MKLVFVLPVLFMCSSLMLIQPAYAVKNPKDTVSELKKKIDELEKEKRKLIPAEKARTFDGQSGQIIPPPKFEPYSYP